VRTIRIKVKPNARSSTLEIADDGTWSARVKSAPVDNKANEELIALVASHFRLRQSQVSITAGASARFKRVQLDAE